MAGGGMIRLSAHSRRGRRTRKTHYSNRRKAHSLAAADIAVSPAIAVRPRFAIDFTVLLAHHFIRDKNQRYIAPAQPNS